MILLLALACAENPTAPVPEAVGPVVTVRTDGPYLSPAEIEALLTAPIEQALQDLPGVEGIQSQSGTGVSTITVTFAAQADPETSLHAVGAALRSPRLNLPPSAAPHVDLVGVTATPQR